MKCFFFFFWQFLSVWRQIKVRKSFLIFHLMFCVCEDSIPLFPCPLIESLLLEIIRCSYLIVFPSLINIFLRKGRVKEYHIARKSCKEKRNSKSAIFHNPFLLVGELYLLVRSPWGLKKKKLDQLWNFRERLPLKKWHIYHSSFWHWLPSTFEKNTIVLQSIIWTICCESSLIPIGRVKGHVAIPSCLLFCPIALSQNIQ